MASIKCSRCALDNDPRLDICFGCGSPLADIAPGSMLAGRYEILLQIGKGGMGQVYKAYDHALGEVIALKVLRPELSRNEEMVKRFRNEVRLARKISHPNVACLYEYGVSDQLQYISMELLDGVTLRQHLRDRGQGLELTQAFGAVNSLAAGLEAIHSEGVIHRDLKTENIIIQAGVLRLMDFGIAKGMAPKAGKPLTRVGIILGTPQFMSPEQCQSSKVDARSDIYSLGIVTWEIFTARLPFDRESPMDTIMLQINEPPPFERAVKQGLPESMVPVLRRALAKQPAGRFDSATEFSEAVEKVREQAKSGITHRITVEAEDPERRLAKRADVSIRCKLSVMDEADRITDHEITLTENIGGGGARVITGISGLKRGQLVTFEELGGSFQTRAKVCGYSIGPDQLGRAHLKFLEPAYV